MLAVVRGATGLKPSTREVGMCLPVYLDEDLPAELVGRGKLLCVVIDWLGEQQISKHLLKVRGHVPLLDHAAVVLDGQDHRIPAQNTTAGRSTCCKLFHFTVTRAGEI